MSEDENQDTTQADAGTQLAEGGGDDRAPRGEVATDHPKATKGSGAEHTRKSKRGDRGPFPIWPGSARTVAERVRIHRTSRGWSDLIAWGEAAEWRKKGYPLAEAPTNTPPRDPDSEDEFLLRKRKERAALEKQIKADL